MDLNAWNELVPQLIDAQGEYNQEIWNLANNTVYGFNPTNSESRVTFYDVVNMVNGEAVATFGTGDTIYIRSQDDAGLPPKMLACHSSTTTPHSIQVQSLAYGAMVVPMIGMMMVFQNRMRSHLMRASKDSDDDGVGDNTDAFPVIR